MKPEVKKLILSNLPYLIFVYLFGKLGQAYRLAAGVDLSEKLLHFMDGCSAAFANAAPSIHPFEKARTPRNTARARNTAAPVGGRPKTLPRTSTPTLTTTFC